MNLLKKVDFIVVHHTVTSMFATREDIKRIALNKGYSDISYHDLVLFDKVVLGRDKKYQGAHCYGLNHCSLGVAVVGDFSKIPPVDKQINLLIQLLAIRCRQYALSADKIITHSSAGKYFVKDKFITECCGKELIKLMPMILKKVSSNL